MNSKCPVYNLVGTAILVVLSLALLLSRPALAAQDTWPKRFEHSKGIVVMYQPQLEDFKDDVLTARAAVSVKTKEMKAPVFRGRLAFRASPDRPGHPAMATIDEVKVTDAKFPDAAPAQLEKLKTFSIPKWRSGACPSPWTGCWRPGGGGEGNRPGPGPEKRAAQDHLR